MVLRLGGWQWYLCPMRMMQAGGGASSQPCRTQAEATRKRPLRGVEGEQNTRWRRKAQADEERQVWSLWATLPKWPVSAQAAAAQHLSMTQSKYWHNRQVFILHSSLFRNVLESCLQHRGPWLSHRVPAPPQPPRSTHKPTESSSPMSLDPTSLPPSELLPCHSCSPPCILMRLPLPLHFCGHVSAKWW